MTPELKWSWQKIDWPQFSYSNERFMDLEAQFLDKFAKADTGRADFSDIEAHSLVVEVMLSEALKTSEIEGEILNRDNVQASLMRALGLESKLPNSVRPAEEGIARMRVDLHRGFAKPLTHETLFAWHAMLMNGRQDLDKIGAYRTHEAPMQVVSGMPGKYIVHFEAPPSFQLPIEMDGFISWFNLSSPSGNAPLPPLTRAGIAHLYFETIHPFEDGNGRIGRALVEMALFQSMEKPIPVMLSEEIYEGRKHYYEMLEQSNKSLQIDDWLTYFSEVILRAQDRTQKQVNFTIEKIKFYDRFRDQLNARQAKVIERVFQEGVRGFAGGLSAANYRKIAKTSPATATRDLDNLVKKGIFAKTGALKSTRYELALFIHKR